MITLESAHFDDNWEECLFVIEGAKVAMGDTAFLDDPDWVEEAKRKWIEGDDTLMGRFEKWSQIRKVLWEHYCTDDGIRHQHELDSRSPWESEDEE